MKTSKLQHVLTCNYTGVPLGTLDLTVTAGHIPYMSHWNEMVCHHALFSLGQYQLCQHMKTEWDRLSLLIANEEATEHETTNLRIGFVALLHNLGSINRDRGCVGLPTIRTVQTNLKSLVGLSYWHNFLQSKRFEFPTLHLSKFNDNSALDNIQDYLVACWDQKVRYEKNLDDVLELERSRVAEQALLAIRNSWIKPVGKKLLWQYCLGYLQGKWAPDAAGWMRTLFLGTAHNAINFDYDEIELLEDILDRNIPPGSLAFAVRERVNQIKQDWKNHYDAFQIEESQEIFIDQLKSDHMNTSEPAQSAYKTKAEFFVARAKWQLANKPLQVEEQSATIKNARKLLDGENEDQDQDQDDSYEEALL